MVGDMVGRHLGRYMIVEEIGRGDVAEVFRALQPDEREVALKVFPRHLAAHPDFLPNVQREASKLTALSHPNIVPVYQAGEAEGMAFLAMRLVEGGSLAKRLESGAIPAAEVARLARQLGAALDHAHQRGILHGDLTPANVLFDESGNALLSDLGLTRILETIGWIARTGTGHPQYVAPEQARTGRADRRSDLYSFGMLLFAMLTGQAAYTGETPVAVLMHQINEPVPRVTEANPGLPASLDRFFAHALAKNPAERFSSAREMAAALGDSLRRPERVEWPFASTVEPTRAAPPIQAEGDEWLPLVDEPAADDGRRMLLGTLAVGALVAVLAAVGFGLLAFAIRTAAQTFASLPSPLDAVLPLTGARVASVAEVVGSLQRRTAGGSFVAVVKGQTLAFGPGQWVRTGRGEGEYASLTLPGDATVFLAPDTEVELAELTDETARLTLSQGRLLAHLPADSPGDFQIVVAAPTRATARIAGSTMGVLFDSPSGQLAADCLDGPCWVGGGEGELSLLTGERGVVDNLLQAHRTVGVQAELWQFAPGLTIGTYGGGFAWRDPFNEREQLRAQRSDRILWPLSGMISSLVLGAWAIGRLTLHRRRDG